MTDVDALAALKRAARAEARARRKAAHAAGASAAAEAVAERMDDAVAATPTCAAGYLPISAELDPQPAMRRLAARGATLALPVVHRPEAPLHFLWWAPGAATATGAFGVQIPQDDWPATPDTLIVPMLAFDRRGYRLGYGGGYYDRTLAQLRAERRIAAIGVAFSAQEVEAVPIGPSDERLDMIVTETEVIACG